MRYYFLFFLFILFTSVGFSQKYDIDSLIYEYNNVKEDTSKIILLLKIGESYYYKNPDSSVYYNKLALKYSEELKKKAIGTLKNKAIFLYANSLYEIAYHETQIMQYNASEKKFNLAIENLNLIIKGCKEDSLLFKSKNLKANIISGIADIYYDKGYYSIALKNYIKARKITDKLIESGFSSEIENAGHYFHIGMIHYELNDFLKALKNYEKSLEISTRNNYKLGIAKCKNNIAIIKLEMGEVDFALNYFKDVLDYVVNNDIIVMQAQVYDNIADCYISKKEYSKAELNLAKAIILVKKINSKQGEIYVNLNFAKLYTDLNKYNKAAFYCKQSVKIAKEIGALSLEKDAYEQLYKIFNEKGNYKKALLYHTKFKSLTDTIFNKEKNRQIAETEAKYESNKKQLEIESQKLEIAKKDARIKRKSLQTVALTILSVLLILFIVFIYFSIRLKQKASKYIRKQNKKITDSIEYAQKIQTAAFPSEKLLYEIFEESFIFNKPLQIVSGDFYWAYKKEHFTAFALADCTGHGIPGAFISIFGISLLNELILNSNLTRPDVILEEMRFHLKKSLSQTGEFEEQTDGIDIALCIIDNKTNELFYAGANQSAYLMRNGDIEELMPVMNPVGIYPKEIPFKMHKRKLEDGDLIYLFSDGFVDQFGGGKKKQEKYTVHRFNKLLGEIYNLPLNEQKEILEKEFNNWMNTNNQLDDVLVFGIKY